MSTPTGKASETFFVVPRQQHDDWIAGVYRHRGYDAEESRAAAEMAGDASWHGIRTHNAIKGLELETKYGIKVGGSRPGAQIRRLPSRFPGSEIWDAQRKLGQAAAVAAMDAAVDLASRYGIGQVSVDNAFHYLWGGGYVLRAAQKGYLAYTNCTAGRAEVVPFQGKAPTLGTNPHTWAFPTQALLGYPILIDWATSVIAFGRVTQCKREGLPLPPGAAVDAQGQPTTDPSKAAALIPFGAHKGYGLALINELVGAYIGGSLPTLRNKWDSAPNEKHTVSYYFQAIHPEALGSGAFARGRSQLENVQAVIEDVLGHGNEGCKLPGQVEAEAAERSRKNGGLLFSAAEIAELSALIVESGGSPIAPSMFKPAV